ncbi:hypothetical protein FSARC_9530 [Fusarium sarcochroum]|uniref:Nucleoside phosphorylase domain-containing protein n=1 Tax=Fusarium sarcochroum TaxID=1208366 RepID=A0A8H4X654_9HYPO|nr:hypothetical protein FSARC_9530 [Fusarium sarcochroum]
MSSGSLTHDSYHVGWICALPKEQTAATAMLDKRHDDLPKTANDPNTYTLGSVGRHNIVIACLPKGKIGLVPAATVAAHLVSTFPSIKFGLMVGIGGGIPPKVRLGDVVVSTPIGTFPGVVQWDFGKAKEGGNFERTGALNNPPTSLLTALTKLETEYELNGSRVPDYLEEMRANWPRIAAKYLKSDSLQDVLFKASYPHVDESPEDYESDDGDGDSEEESCRFCDKTKVVKRRAKEFRVHHGLIASGNQVIKDALFRDRLNKDLGGHVLCVEMEAAGLSQDFPCLIIRGICDYADSHKNKEWQEHAAAAAAAFAKELLVHIQPSDVDGERPVVDILREVRQTASATHQHITRLESRMTKNEDLRILNSLTAIDYTPQQKDFFDRRQPGTGQWFLESPESQKWLEVKQRTLFCPGNPGAGKTILASIIINDLISRFGVKQDVGIAYIYCNFQQHSTQSAEDIIKSLLKQLVQGLSSPPDYVRDLCANGSKISPATLKISWEQFNNVTSLEIHAHDQDIRSYLVGAMSQLPKIVSRNPGLQEEVITKIIEAVDGMFLLARLHLESLRGKRSVKSIRTALKNLETGSQTYDHAYLTAMQRIKGQFHDEEELAMQVLMWITHAMRPLHVRELQTALAVEVASEGLDEDNLPEAEQMVSVCAGLVTIDRERRVIRLVHYTTQEYLERTGETWFPTAHEDMMRICITYLSFKDFVRQSSLFSWHNPLYRTNPLLFYAMDNWGDHSRNAPHLSSEVVDFLECDANVQFASGRSEATRLIGISLTRDWRQSTDGLTGLHLAARFGLEREVEALLQKGFDVDAETPDGETPLWFAIERHHTVVVAQLLERGAAYETSCGLCTPLIHAILGGFEDIVGILINKGASVNEISEDSAFRGYEKYWSPLSVAAEKGNTAITKMLLSSGADPRLPVQNYPLRVAVAKGYDSIVKMLLESGADPEFKSFSENTPLASASIGGHETTAKILLDSGAHVDGRSLEGITPLMCAYEQPGKEMFKLLLQSGADIAARDNDGQTPLVHQAKHGSKLGLKTLLENGADTEAKAYYGDTSLVIATQRLDEAKVRVLLEYGADSEARDKNGQTPLMLSCQNNYEPMIKLLLEHGANTEARDNDGQTPLVLSCRRQNVHEEVVKLLLEYSADTNARDKNGQTPFILSCQNGHEAIVKLLHEHGADTEDRDKDGQTPLVVSCRNGHEMIVKLLVKYGANVAAQNHCGETPLVFAARELRGMMAWMLYAPSKSYPHPLTIVPGIKESGSMVAILVRKDRSTMRKDQVYIRSRLSVVIDEGFDPVLVTLLDNGPELDFEHEPRQLDKLSLGSFDIIVRSGASVTFRNWAYWDAGPMILRRRFNVLNLLLENGAEMGRGFAWDILQ